MASKHMMQLLVLGLFITGSDAARKPKKPKPAPAPAPSPAPSQFYTDAAVTHTLSLTVTPGATEGGMVVDDGERMQSCADMLAALDVEMALRHADGQIPYALFTRERGERENNPHLQGHYDITTTASTPAEIKALIKEEKRWLKGVLESATTIRLRIVLKLVKAKDRTYGYGYDQKDTGQAHYICISVGFTTQELVDALNYYRSVAGKSAFSSKKMNKAPSSDKKQLAFAVGSLFVMCAWFVAQHNLKRLSKYLTPAIVIAFALSTTCYRVDDSLVTGRNGGAILDPSRSQAFFDLGFADVNDTASTIPLIETVLFGAPLKHSTYQTATDAAAGIPSTAELAAGYSLEAAKALCAGLDTAAPDAPPKAKNGGRCIVLDFLSSRQSAEAAHIMQSAGLRCTTRFALNQRANACGYLSAGWACELRHLGAAFDTMPMETAMAINSATFVQAQNIHLDRADLGPVAVWLTGDEILRLAAVNNPDTTGGEVGHGNVQDADWLSGPGPMNYWRVHFARTLVDPRDHGRVHIMVVNTEDATSDFASAPATMGGSHWFVAAWLVEPDEEGTGGE